MITLAYPRLGIIVRQAFTERLLQDRYQLIYRKLINEYQDNKHTQNGKIAVTPGKVKVDATFPSIWIEAESRRDDLVAINYTKEVTLSYKVTIAVKNLASPKGETSYDGKIEDYITSLAEFTWETLNEPGTLQFNIQMDENRVQFPDNGYVRVHDSRAENLIYAELYSGALRIARFTWWAKLMYLGGTTGILGNYNE